MKYAIISDIHGNLEALNAVLSKTKSEGIDKYICVGDIVGYNANPVECLKIIQSLDLVAIVRGNHDEYVGSDNELIGFNPSAKAAVMWTKQQLTDSQRKWLAQLKLKWVSHKENITIVHATLDSPGAWGYIFDVHHAKDNFSYQMTQFCFCGHSHVPVLFKKVASVGNTADVVSEISGWERFPDNETEMTVPVEFGYKYLVNIGSVGQPRNGDPRASFVIYDSYKKILRRICVKYDIAAVQEKIRMAHLPENLASRLEFGY